MIGIGWRREQGLADPLLRKMLAESGLEDVPQWTKENGNKDKRAKYLAYMKQRKEDGYRSPNRL